MKLNILIFSIFCLTFNVNSQTNDKQVVQNAKNDLNNYWLNLSNIFGQFIKEQSEIVYKNWLTAKAKTNIQNNVSKKCLDVIEHVIKNPIDEEWSAKLIDSMNTFPTGILSGSSTQLGDFDQCLSIEGNFNQQEFVGKYCLAIINLPKTKQFQAIHLNGSDLNPRWLLKAFEQWNNNDNWFSFASGICFPSICNQEEIKTIIRTYYPSLNSIDFDLQYCQSRNESRQYHWGIHVALAIVIFHVIMVIMGTFTEAVCDPEVANSFIRRFIQSFSLISNTKILFRFGDNDSSNQSETDNKQFQYIHGIRALASIFIISCHSFGLMSVPLLMKVSAYSRYPNDMKQTSKMFWSQPIFNGALIVQTFFTMSGMLLTYNALAPKLKIKFIPYTLLRWLRYTPPLIGTICMTMICELFGSGPLFHHDLIWPTVRRCYDRWWKNLLYINNFEDFNDQCSTQTWYLSAEMQLHVIGFLILLAYLKGPRLAYFTSAGLVVLGTFIIISVISLGLTPLSLFQIFAYTEYPFPNNAIKWAYFPPYMHFIPYFLGGIVGQVLLEKRNLNLSNRTKKIFSILTVIVFLTYPFSSYIFIRNDQVIILNPTWIHAIQYVIFLLLWGLANAWLFYFCSTNGASAITRFLSAKIFQPISRLSFSLYLIHLMTIWFNAHQTRTTISLVNFNQMYQLICISMVQSFVLAYFLYSTFEAPSVNLMKLLLKPKLDEAKKQKENKKSN